MTPESILVTGESHFSEAVLQVLDPGDVEGRFHHGFGGAFSHRLGGGSLPEEKGKGPDDDGLPRTGLPGEDVQAGFEIQGEVVDDGVVPDAEFDEHVGESRKSLGGFSMGGGDARAYPSP